MDIVGTQGLTAALRILQKLDAFPLGREGFKENIHAPPDFAWSSVHIGSTSRASPGKQREVKDIVSRAAPQVGVSLPFLARPYHLVLVTVAQLGTFTCVIPCSPHPILACHSLTTHQSSARWHAPPRCFLGGSVPGCSSAVSFLITHTCPPPPPPPQYSWTDLLCPAAPLQSHTAFPTTRQLLRAHPAQVWAHQGVAQTILLQLQAGTMPSPTAGPSAATAVPSQMATLWHCSSAGLRSCERQ